MPKDTRKIVLITGCSAGGIGEGLAKQFHAQGLRVIATTRNVCSMKSLADMGIETLRLDVTSQSDIAEVKSYVSELAGGKLDILVNNAGMLCPVPVSDLTADIIKQVFDVNFFGAIMMVQVFLPLLIASGNGRVMLMGSVGGTMPVPFLSVYGSSKAALHSFGDTLRLELAPFNVKVITIASGSVESNLTQPQPWHGIPPNSLYQPISEDVKQRMGHFGDGAWTREKFSQRVVAEALKRNPTAWLYAGAESRLSWWLTTFGGRKLFEWIFPNMFGLRKLRRIVREKGQ